MERRMEYLSLSYGKYGKVTKIIGRDGIERTKVEIEGSYGKKDGVFEFIIWQIR